MKYRPSASHPENARPSVCASSSSKSLVVSNVPAAKTNQSAVTFRRFSLMLLASTPLRRPASASKTKLKTVALIQISGFCLATVSSRLRTTLRRLKVGHFDHLAVMSSLAEGNGSGREGEEGNPSYELWSK